MFPFSNEDPRPKENSIFMDTQAEVWFGRQDMI